MQNFSTSPGDMAASFWHHRGLINKLIKREVIGRYRGFFMSILYNHRGIHPILGYINPMQFDKNGLPGS